MKAWDSIEAPTKSSLTPARNRIHFSFFERQFRKLVGDFESRRFELRGYRIYAIDGRQLSLPCTESILGAGYRGAALPRGKETYRPNLYLTHAFDVLSGVTKDLRFNSHRQEILHAIDMVAGFERNSISLYDRLYLSKKLIHAHNAAGNYFIARCKRSAFDKVDEFFASNKTRGVMRVNGIVVHLTKTINPRTKEALVLATNLPIGIFSKKELAGLYTRRWLIEGNFRDSSSGHLQIENWHSKNINGILQELFTHHWVMNLARIQVSLQTVFNPTEYLGLRYHKPNFKLLLEIIVDAISDLARGRWRRLIEKIHYYIQKTMETRFHLKRDYPRHIKSPQRRYQRANTVKRRAA